MWRSKNSNNLGTFSIFYDKVLNVTVWISSEACLLIQK
nr:MAG TPA: hypothetical protein [Caudoviricetes sp.]DAT27892.1 MAG TPA: hypothetical protein [Caudoviricetes sp.]